MMGDLKWTWLDFQEREAARPEALSRRKRSGVHRHRCYMPIDLLDALGVEKILAMGAQHSGGVFSYQSRRLNGEPTTIHMAYFRQSFALLLGVFPRFSDVPPQALAHIVIH
ncbi:hypothetical protein CN233_35950 [Sinorhizobium meliloti]|uniref:hypothetical protein n=1 Tax=Rhizobium meliloti TaxID=382 RepID=UPI000FDC16F2|nr:hypothetical protein [Sinorhizobium meliloti]QPI29080.1 hypothetical protein I0J99_30500 [Sinorhizobium meliloti]RVG19759.1 hypothetical protein CN233_35950 [Sinorhizobium meliloti]RVK93381.1 hypothetical protein CN152_23250 [Sinorhizobium meliloti]RVN34073.1 hypothetical protein CN113_35395 [Sinorhizobium meliloti]RVQ07253.1 hypothetical protein CN069_01800 [Sinorhizobium meliloti]